MELRLFQTLASREILSFLFLLPFSLFPLLHTYVMLSFNKAEARY